jgi:cytochrome c-type biogenesis protein CcmH/NrfG
MKRLAAALLLACLLAPLQTVAGESGGNIDEVQAAVEQAVAANPQNRDALYMLGLIYEKKHQVPDALRTWRRYLAVETDPARRSVAEKHIHLLSQ